MDRVRLIVMILTISSVVSAAALFAPLSAGANDLRNARHHHHIHHPGSWGDHDRAVYVVTTLNAPICPDGQQLSTYLGKADGARLFDVLKSTVRRNLYYIQVKTVDRKLLGVYGYRFGWKVPGGVKSSKCVKAVPDASIVATYRHREWRVIGHFRTTYPQS